MVNDVAMDSPPNAPVISSIDDGVATITLNASERKNSLSPMLVNALADELDAAIDDPSVRVIVLTNAGQHVLRRC